MELDAVIQRYQHDLATTVFREPHPEDASRWHQQRIGERTWRVAQPVTLTPYAAVQPCSARCRFCSENLRENGDTGTHASLLRPGMNYFNQLQTALMALRGLPLSYSLSGLEMTDHRDWFLRLLDCLSSHAAVSPVEGRVLYSNGAGLTALGEDAALAAAIRSFTFDWVELSRHHPDTVTNQQIMRFRSREGVMITDQFRECVAQLGTLTEVKLVCLVQQGGVDSLAALQRYLDWARSLGVRHVILREMSQLDQRYRANGTQRYIRASRVSVAGLLQAFLEAHPPAQGTRLRQATHGYYFSNLVIESDGLTVTFESSNYQRLHEKHDSGQIFKLVFHANGNLCADWNPERHVLIPAVNGDITHAQ